MQGRGKVTSGDISSQVQQKNDPRKHNPGLVLGIATYFLKNIQEIAYFLLSLGEDTVSGQNSFEAGSLCLPVIAVEFGCWWVFGFFFLTIDYVIVYFGTC